MLESKRSVIIFTYLLFILLSVSIIAASVIYGSGILPVIAVLIEVVISVRTVITQKPGFKASGRLLMSMCILNIWIFSLMTHDFFNILIMSACTAALISFYNNSALIYIMTVNTVVLLLYSIFVNETVSVIGAENLLRIFMLTGSSIAAQLLMAAFINNKNYSDEQMRKSIDKAHHAEQAKSDFLANMSHEIRTPMNAIIGMCELILRDENDLSETAAENCLNIKASGRNLLSIINDILDFSKIESGNMELNEAPYDISSVINDVVNTSAAGLNGKKLEIISDIYPGIPRGLIGDELRIRQVITNLMGNAVKFTSQGAIVLKVSKRDTEYGINLKVSVEDTGIGITPADLEKLFISFQQVDTKKNRSVEGTGLGLAISKRFVRMMGGFINVKSEYGKGSVFSFVIPQKVSDSRPFVSIENSDSINCAVFVRCVKNTNPVAAAGYKGLVDSMSKGLNLRVKVFDDLAFLRQAAAVEKFTHFFLSKQEYLEDKQFFEMMSHNAEVIVIQDRYNSAQLAPRIRCIYTPVSIISLAAALNREKFVNTSAGAIGSAEKFTAPRARVLIVDDNEVNLKVAAGLMRPYGFRIDTASSGREAVSMLRNKDFHIVFMDHMMPEMDGVETTSIIRSNSDRYFKELPIVALTANAVGSAREMFLSSGFNDFLSKPIELSSLDRILKKYIPPELVIKAGEESPAKNVPDIPEEEPENEWFSSSVGMKYSGNDKEAYLEILRLYLRNGQMKFEEIQTLYECRSWKNYIIEVHALKSSSKSIGSDKLFIAAAEIENAGKSEDYQIIETKHYDMMKGYKIVLSTVDSYIREQCGSDTSGTEYEGEYMEISEKELSIRICEMIDALQDFDTDRALKFMDSLDRYSYKGQPVPLLLEQARLYAEEYEYSKAAEAAAAVTGVKISDD